MIVKQTDSNIFEVVMTDEEIFNLLVIVNNSQLAQIIDIASLINFQLSYLSDMAFTVEKEPLPNGNSDTR